MAKTPVADAPGSRRPEAAYVHVPFCAHRCGYCNFTLVAGRDDLIERYLQAIERELSWLNEPQNVKTLFIGGGTPTHLGPKDLERLLTIVRRWFPLAEGGEFSVEANPIDIDHERVAVLRDFGVNRVSLGAQSFSTGKLRTLERDHTAEHVCLSFELLRPHVCSLSLDLIFGAPGETLESWKADVEAALALTPDHLSVYGLTFERGTTFWSRRERGNLTQIEESIEATMYETAIDRLTGSGFEHYEVSNFATAGHRCRHNETYWAAESYWAAGPGAARYVNGRREVNHRSTTTYLARVLADESPVADTEQLGKEDRAREALVLAMRRLEGVDREVFRERFVYSVDELGGDDLRRFIAEGLLSDDGARVRLTRRGLLVSDALWPALLRV